MSLINTILSDHLVSSLGWTFIHSLWQGCLIALVMIVVLSKIPTRNAMLRYAVATGSMLTMLFSALATFIMLYADPSTVAPSTEAISVSALVTETSTKSFSLQGWLNEHMSLLVLIWGTGALVLGLRLIFGLLYIEQLKAKAITMGNSMLETATDIANRIDYKKPLRVAESALIEIPIVIGYFKPVILFPVGAVNQLSTEEVEAVLAHEIAHLVRNDFIQNLFQSVIEVLFYYHPAVWWISAVVRSERENCCDDLAIQACGSSFSYARALVRLQEVGSSAPALALPLNGSNNHLLKRVKRILNQPQNKSNVMEKITATSLLLLCLIFASFSGIKSDEIDNKNEAIAPFEMNDFIHEAIHDTIIPRSSITISRTEDDGKQVKAQYENGELSYLSIDGKEIPKSEYGTYENIISEMQVHAANVPAPPAPPAPPAFVMPDMPDMPPMPEMAPMAPMPDMPDMPPMPEMPAMAPMPAMPEMPEMPEMPPMPPMPEMPAYNFNAAPQLSGDAILWGETETTKTRTESVIVRDENADGSYSYRVEGDHADQTLIEILPEEGIAIIDGEEITIDADSILVIEEIETKTPARHMFWTNKDHDSEGHDKFLLHDGDSLHKRSFNFNYNYNFEMPEEFEVEMREFEGKWNEEEMVQWKEEMKVYMEENQGLFEEYSEEYKNQMKEWKENNPEWESRMKEYKERAAKLMEDCEKNGSNAAIFLRDSDDVLVVRDRIVEQKRLAEVREVEAREHRVQRSDAKVREDKLIIIDLSDDAAKKKEDAEKAAKAAKKKGHTSVQDAANESTVTLVGNVVTNDDGKVVFEVLTEDVVGPPLVGTTMTVYASPQITSDVILELNGSVEGLQPKVAHLVNVKLVGAVSETTKNETKEN